MNLKRKVVVTLTVMLFAIQLWAVYLYRQVFFKRCSRDIPFWQYGISEFPGLNRKRVEFVNNRNVTLRGYFYYMGDQKETIPSEKGIILMANGYLQSHQDYMTDIAFFSKEGFTVFGFDNMACYESDGKNMLGLDQAVLDLKSALRYLEKTVGNKQEIYLYGHSMGAYAGAVVLGNTQTIKRAVLRSGFSKPNQIIFDALTVTYGKCSGILMPFLFVCRLCLFPQVVCKNAVKELKNTKAEVLILQCMDDAVVPWKHSLYGGKKHLKGKENIGTRIFYGRGHDLARGRDAVRYYFQKEKERTKLVEKYGGKNRIPQKVWEDFMQSTDRKRINAYDMEVLDRMSLFFENGFS